MPSLIASLLYLFIILGSSVAVAQNDALRGVPSLRVAQRRRLRMQIITVSPTSKKRVTQSPSKSHGPSISPTGTPQPTTTVGPSPGPSSSPKPSPSPSFKPIPLPSAAPTVSIKPSDVPSQSPTITGRPTSSDPPSAVPTMTKVPSAAPSDIPSVSPSLAPTVSQAPTVSDAPSRVPSDQPSMGVQPTGSPAVITLMPTKSPVLGATPTGTPVAAASDTPSDSPSSQLLITLNLTSFQVSAILLAPTVSGNITDQLYEKELESTFQTYLLDGFSASNYTDEIYSVEVKLVDSNAEPITAAPTPVVNATTPTTNSTTNSTTSRRFLQTATTATYTFDGEVVFVSQAPPSSLVLADQQALLEDTQGVQNAVNDNEVLSAANLTVQSVELLAAPSPAPPPTDSGSVITNGNGNNATKIGGGVAAGVVGLIGLLGFFVVYDRYRGPGARRASPAEEPEPELFGGPNNNGSSAVRAGTSITTGDIMQGADQDTATATGADGGGEAGSGNQPHMTGTAGSGSAGPYASQAALAAVEAVAPVGSAPLLIAPVSVTASFSSEVEEEKKEDDSFYNEDNMSGTKDDASMEGYSLKSGIQSPAPVEAVKWITESATQKTLSHEEYNSDSESQFTYSNVASVASSTAAPAAQMCSFALVATQSEEDDDIDQSMLFGSMKVLSISGEEVRLKEVKNQDLPADRSPGRLYSKSLLEEPHGMAPRNDTKPYDEVTVVPVVGPTPTPAATRLTIV